MSVAVEKPRARAAVLSAPRILEMPPERMAVVDTVGDPNQVGKQAIQALYGAVYGLKFAEKMLGRDFKVKPLRARWTNWQEGKPSELRGTWGLPVPPSTRSIPQKVPGMTVRLETWTYGTVAEILHVGAYAAERPTIERLLTFIREEGYQVNGAHEEEYLTRPDSKVVKTVIRYPVQKATPSRTARIHDGGGLP